MSTLIVQLPARARLAPHLSDPSRSDPGLPADPPELDYAFCADGLHLSHQGRAAPAHLPAASSVVAVLDPRDVAWHPLAQLPKAPPSKLRAALAGLLEESLLEDDHDVHLAAPARDSVGDAGTWVAAAHKAWLQHWIAQLEQGERRLDRIVPGWAPLGPEGTPAAHVWMDGEHPQLAWRDAQGAACLPLHSPLVRQLLAAVPPEQTVHWSGQGEGADAAAHLAGAPVAARSLAESLMAAAASPWNLRQFDLAPRHRSDRAARALLQKLWHDPAGRWARRGLLGLLIVNLLGANLWAWQQRSALAQRKQAMTALLQSAFPNVRAVFDPPAQMQKEIDLRRAAAGRPGETDLEPLLYAAQAAWPPSRGPADSLRFEANRLSLGSPGWNPQELQAFRARLWPMGLDAEQKADQLVVSRLVGPPPVPAGMAPGAGRPGGPGGPGGPGPNGLPRPPQVNLQPGSGQPLPLPNPNQPPTDADAEADDPDLPPAHRAQLAGRPAP